MSTRDPYAAARDAIEHGDWSRAIAELSDAGAADPTAEALELLAHASYGVGDLEGCVSAWERSHARLEVDGDIAGAARAAAMIAMYLMMDTGLMAPVRGWLRRAERLLEGHEEVPAHALIPMVRAYERLMCGDMEAVRDQSAAAIELGGRLGVQPAVVIGRVAAARARIFAGEVEEGLELLDEVGAVLMSGAVDALTTGMMYCELICAAQGLGLHDRAGEWTDVMEHWRHGAAFGGINGRCRVHRAEMLRLSGPCDQAEEEALRACDELRPWMRREFGWPLVELGNIRLRRGDLDGAAEAFHAAHEHAWSPQPGLALLRLEQGNSSEAAAMIADAIAHPFDIPSKERPPFGDLRLAPLLDAQVTIAAATGDASTARRAADRLATIADSYQSAGLQASAQLAAGRAALTHGDLEEAIERSSAAVAAWAEIRAPFETAMARMVLADACSRAGNPAGARMEWEAASTAFEQFGAARWAATASELAAGSSPMTATVPASTRSGDGAGAVRRATFRRDGDMRIVEFDGSTVHLRDLQGLRYIERLLAEPGREFHVLDLVAVEHGTLPTETGGLDPAAEPGISGRGGDGLPLIDAQAREAYRRRLNEVDEDIEEATRLNDIGRAELAERDREYLVRELERAVGLGGRHRTVGGGAERARSSVTRSIRYGLQRLADHHREVAEHLDRCVRTGTYCVYSCDPLVTIVWDL